MTRRTLVLVAVIVLALVLVAGGLLACKKQDPEVVAAWPEADTERTIAKPAEPPRWPLTGLEAPSAEETVQRVVSVKIENSSESRPQTNLQLADVVYESVTEGGITRFNAIFHSQAPENVGPVRSARLSDTYIVPQYHALFGFSGASPTVNAAVNAAGIENLRIWIDSGETDQWAEQARQLSLKLRERGIDNILQIYPGGHDYNYWSEHGLDYIRFYGNSLAQQ